jgi:hypothetical protein
MIVSSRTLVLAVAATAVVVLGVYLFVEVRADPTAAPPAVASDKPRAQPGEAAQTPPEIPRPRGRVAPPQVREPAPAGSDRRPGEQVVAQAPDQMMKANPRMDDLMLEANKAYDNGEYDRAREIAQQVLTRQPSNIRMLRVMVSAACMEGDQTAAQTYYNQLPSNDRAQMRTRCADKMGISFTEPASGSGSS